MKKPSKEAIKNAIEQAHGLIKPAATSLGVTRKTLYVWINDDEELKDLVMQERESLIDLAESRLFQNVNDGDTVSILFALKTLGKNRGYIEKQEIDYSEKTIKVNVPEE
jgi:hypothetical protein